MGIRTAINPLGTLPETPDNETYLIKFIIDTRGNNASDTTFIFPIAAGTYSNIGTPVIDWGDGTSTTYSDGVFNQTNCTHTYSTPGAYEIKCKNTTDTVFPDFNFYSNYRTTSNNYKKVRIAKILGGITIISSNSFRQCDSLCKVVVGNTVTFIDQNAFWDSTNISKFVLSENLTYIGNSAFRQCDNLSSITIPNSVTTIDTYAFFGCDNLKNVTFGNSLTSIGTYAFQQCPKLTNITIPNSVTSIGAYAFADTGLTSITIPDSITTINGSMFRNCDSLISVTIPNSVTTIDTYVFFNCGSLTNVTIPENITKINSWAFQNCTSLASVVYSGYVPNIASQTFNGCTSVMLYDFSHATSIPSLNSTSSLGHATNCVIKVPSALLTDWQNTNVWKDLTGVVWQGV